MRTARSSTTIKDPYGVLGIGRDADEEAIKRAYREKAKVLHPDTTTDEGQKKEMEEKFKELNASYDILSDPQKKAAFDNPASQFRQGVDMNDIISHMFGGNGAGFFHFGGGVGGNNPNVSFHRTFQQSFDIDVFTLMTGGEVGVKFPDGKERKFNVPPNTPANARFQVNMDKNVTVILTPNIVIPKLSEEQLKKLREIIGR